MWKRNRFDLVLAPLNSHIGYLLPRLQEEFLLFQGGSLNVATCIPLRELADRPYYTLPKPAARMIAERASQMTGQDGEKVGGLNILILDDAVASGRTLDTIVRALSRESSDLMERNGLSRSPVSALTVYAVIDRRSLARQTLQNEIARLRLIGEQRAAYPPPHTQPLAGDIDFSLSTWLRMDMPVEESGSCYLCDERDSISAMLAACRLPLEHPIRAELQSRQAALDPQSTETPRFLEGLGAGRKIEIQWSPGLQSTTYEVALLDFHNLLSRGFPIGSLVEKYQELALRNPSEEEDAGATVDLRAHMGREFLRRWKQVCSQQANAAWLQAMENEVAQGSTLARQLLPLAGMAMARSGGTEEDGGLVALCEKAVKQIGSRGDTTAMWNLAAGASLWLLYHSHYLPPDKESSAAVAQVEKALQTTIEGTNATETSRLFLEVVRGTLACPAGERRFLPSLRTVLNHTLRPARNPKHSHLVPFNLQRIAEGDSLDQWQGALWQPPYPTSGQH